MGQAMESESEGQGRLIGSRFRLKEVVGTGGYGSVWTAWDLAAGEEPPPDRDGLVSPGTVAVKLERVKEGRRRKPTLRMEALILNRLRDRFGAASPAPQILACGSAPESFLALELVGPDLSRLRRASAFARLAPIFALRMGTEALKALRDLHSLGFVHRDVKPSNFALGGGPRQLLLLDFGLSRQMGLWDGRWRGARADVGFRGTRAYASTRALQRREQSRRDDLQALFYLLLELLRGSLPWKHLREPRSILDAKLLYPHLIDGLPVPHLFHAFQAEVSELSFSQAPDYPFLLDTLQQIADAFPH